MTAKFGSPAKSTRLLVLESAAERPFSKVAVSVQYLAAIAMTGLATVVAVAFDSQAAIPNLSLVFVIPVVGAAVVYGLGPSICSAIAGALAYNFFLTEPRYTLRVDDPANIWAIGLLFVVGVIASAVASTARRRADDAALGRYQIEVVHAYSREIAGAGEPDAMFSVTANALEALFRVPVAVMLISESVADVVERRGEMAPSDGEIEAARFALANGKPTSAGVYPFDASRFDFWPVMTSAGNRTVIGLAFDSEERPALPGILVEIVGNLLVLALDRQRFTRGGDLEMPQRISPASRR